MVCTTCGTLCSLEGKHLSGWHTIIMNTLVITNEKLSLGAICRPWLKCLDTWRNMQWEFRMSSVEYLGHLRWYLASSMQAADEDIQIELIELYGRPLEPTK